MTLVSIIAAICVPAAVATTIYLWTLATAAINVWRRK